MNSRLISDVGRQSYVLVFETGDEAIEGLRGFAREHRLSAAQLTGIGAFSSVVLGYFDWEKKDYQPIRVDEQVEAVALIGDIALENAAPTVHVHVVTAAPDGAARGSHLLEG